MNESMIAKTMEKKGLLQRIVFPTIEERDCAQLFFRQTKERFDAFGESCGEVEVLSFDTWMNIFAAKKWFHYCAIENVFFGAEITGNYSLEIVGTKHDAAFTIINTTLFSVEYNNESSEMVYVPVPDADRYDAIYVRIMRPGNRGNEMRNMGWYTDSPVRRDNTLAIVTCTYKREVYVYKTMSLFRDYLKQNPDLLNKMHLFVVDNGRTLPIDAGDDAVDIVHNINAGGAGGFGRGMIEACRSKHDFTRCLLMDDDVKILPECFYRTLIFTDYLKDEYANATVNGAMLDLYQKNIFVENLAIQDGLWVRSSNYPGDLNQYDTVLRVNEFNDDIWRSANPKPNAAWFYSCFDFDREETINNLPLPIFIRGDDVEYGWRNNGKPFIQLNGIFVWHAPFGYRVNRVTDCYYLVRNMIIINMLYTDGFENICEKLIGRKFRDAIAQYDYKSAGLILEGIRDALSGRELFTIDPVSLHGKMSSMAKEDTITENDWNMLEGVRNKRYHYGAGVRMINKIVKLLYRVFPVFKILLKRNTEKSVCECTTPNEAFLFRKNIRVYDLLNRCYYFRKYSYREEKKLQKEFRMQISALHANYERLKKEYKDLYSELTSYAFWQDYLRLEE